MPPVLGSRWARRASFGVIIKTTPLLTVEEADQALGAPEYRLSCTGTVRLARSQPVALVARRYAESAGRPGAGGSIDQGWLKSCALLTSPPEGPGFAGVAPRAPYRLPCIPGEEFSCDG